MWARISTRKRKIGEFNAKYQASKAKMICLAHGLFIHLDIGVAIFAAGAFLHAYSVIVSLSLP